MPWLCWITRWYIILWVLKLEMNYRYPKYFATCYQYWLADHGLPPVLAVMYKWIFYQMIPTSEKSLQNGDSVSKWKMGKSVDLCIMIILYYIILLKSQNYTLNFMGKIHVTNVLVGNIIGNDWALDSRTELWWFNHQGWWVHKKRFPKMLGKP